MIDSIFFFFPFYTKRLFFTLTVDAWRSTECCLKLEYTGNGTFCFTSASDAGIQLVINALCLKALCLKLTA